MNFHRRFLIGLAPLAAPAFALADEAAKSPAASPAAAATAVVVSPERTPDLLEHLVDVVLNALHVPNTGDNTLAHYGIAAGFLVCGVLLRRVVTNIIFHYLKRLASKTETTLDDKLFPAMEAPTATFVMLLGVFASLKVLKLSESTDHYISLGSTVAFSLAIFWGLYRAFDAILEHAHEVALEKQMGVSAFMPWIKKFLITIFVLIGILVTIQSLGYDVKAALGALGIGGLAFALAAQDTIANIFGSVVVATDQPFRIGETVTIGTHTGTVEDIGLRSTKIRKVDRSLVTVPNRTVANESIVNLSRFTARRVEQVIGIAYDAHPEQLEGVVADIRRLIESDPAVNAPDTHVYFRDYGASSLDVWLVYVVKDADFAKHMQVRQRLNFGIMRAIEARGLSFAFPTQTVHVASLPTTGKA
ncbi:MAG: mechanosensitive ion channel family protein [Opitutae bacterium]|nr:mechanosensitive ion channel family protein [Opitutae bacterium]